MFVMNRTTFSGDWKQRDRSYQSIMPSFRELSPYRHTCFKPFDFEDFHIAFESKRKTHDGQNPAQTRPWC
jgi:hypothetical protein